MTLATSGAMPADGARTAITAAPVPAHDQLLVRALQREIERQGGRARIFSLLTYAPGLRTLLLDRRLLDVLVQYPGHFQLRSRHISSSQVGSRQHANIVTDVSLVSSPPSCAAATATAAVNDTEAEGRSSTELTTATGNRILLHTQWRLEQLSPPSASLSTLCRNTRIKRSLTHLMRFRCSTICCDGSQRWWEAAMREFRGLLLSSQKFSVSPTEEPGGMEALRSTTVVLLCGDEALQGPGQELQSRIVHLLQREPSSELSLSRIGQDRCVQRLLRGRSLRDFVQQQQQQRMAGARDTCWDIRKGEHDVVLRQLPTLAGISGVVTEAPRLTPTSVHPRSLEDTAAHFQKDVAVDVALQRPPCLAVLVKPPNVSTEAYLHCAARSTLLSHSFGPHHPAGIPSVSRLDKPTSGALVVPLSHAGEEHLTTLFKERRVDKTYIALVNGETPPEGVIQMKLMVVSQRSEHFRVYASPKGKEAVTQYRRVAVLKQSNCEDGDEKVYSLVEASPKTGRTHQIRAHFAALGHPLVSDTKYKSKLGKRQLSWCPRLFLHAARVRLHDTEGENVDVSVPLSTDLQDVLNGMVDTHAE
jgi:23S rRNA-/tRNA-specific pseudouridylate synthase